MGSTADWLDILRDTPATGLSPMMTVREILARPSAGADVDSLGLQAMATWIASFLTTHHAKLGRPGAVCPYAERSIAEDSILLASSAIDTVGPEAEASIVATMLRLQGPFAVDRAAPEPGHRSIVVVFPRLSEPDGSAMIERVQRSLKLSFIEHRLMIGQFFPSCAESGLHNRDFRPLQSPLICLAIRDIAISDAAFMLSRQDYIDAYLGIFGELGAGRVAAARVEHSDRK
jgi:hypothetical protein